MPRRLYRVNLGLWSDSGRTPIQRTYDLHADSPEQAVWSASCIDRGAYAPRRRATDLRGVREVDHATFPPAALHEPLPNYIEGE